MAKEAPNTEYYAFSDQDDVWLPDKLDRAISFLKNTDNKKPAMYACGQIVVDENLEFMFQHNMNPNRSKDDFFAKNSFPEIRLYLIGNCSNCLKWQIYQSIRSR